MVYIFMDFDKGIESCIHYHDTMHNSFIIPKAPSKVFWNKQTKQTQQQFKLLINFLIFVCEEPLRLNCDWPWIDPTIHRASNTQQNAVNFTQFSTLISLKSQIIQIIVMAKKKKSSGVPNADHISWSLKDSSHFSLDLLFQPYILPFPFAYFILPNGSQTIICRLASSPRLEVQLFTVITCTDIALVTKRLLWWRW